MYIALISESLSSLQSFVMVLFVSLKRVATNILMQSLLLLVKDGRTAHNVLFNQINEEGLLT